MIESYGDEKGFYDVNITVTGYQQWAKQGIEVSVDMCGLVTVELEIPLTAL
ncbi:hypothetical protein ACVFI8_19960 [Agarivorans sp. MS3-6]